MLHPTAVPGSAFDLVVTGETLGRTVTLIKPGFVVVGAQYASMAIEFPAGSDSLHVFNPVTGQPLALPQPVLRSARSLRRVLCAPANGNLTIRLIWRASAIRMTVFYGRLTVDPPGHLSQSVRSPCDGDPWQCR